jgi:hypothetical protein
LKQLKIEKMTAQIQNDLLNNVFDLANKPENGKQNGKNTLKLRPENETDDAYIAACYRSGTELNKSESFCHFFAATA